jgi:hypothetical protein
MPLLSCLGAVRLISSAAPASCRVANLCLAKWLCAHGLLFLFPGLVLLAYCARPMPFLPAGMHAPTPLLRGPLHSRPFCLPPSRPDPLLQYISIVVAFVVPAAIGSSVEYGGYMAGTLVSIAASGRLPTPRLPASQPDPHHSLSSLPSRCCWSLRCSTSSGCLLPARCRPSLRTTGCGSAAS